MAAASTSPMLPALLLIALAAATTGAAEMTALDWACNFVGGWYVTPELCTSVLCADPSEPCRATRDAPAVAALAATLAVRNATATKGRVEAALAAHAGNVTVAKGIESCVQLYAGVVAILQRAAQFVATRRYSDARQVLDAAYQDMLIGVPGRCEAMAGDAAALPRENEAFMNMALVAHAIIANMARD
ncbi:hypothetical protein EJB05_00603, partial [Eragrostis curvula]